LGEPAPGTHRVVVGSRPSLYECFNQADFLIADISSVVSDFIESQNPTR
jgi:CDP-glycerol glycerophosphotransferase (TagB/SpsB family)